MTEENYNYRTSQALLRNQFPGKGKLQIPIIPKEVNSCTTARKITVLRQSRNLRSVIRGGEPVFLWNGDVYGVCFVDSGYCIARSDGTHERICSSPDAVLEYTIHGDRLRDIITRVTVISRNI